MDVCVERLLRASYFLGCSDLSRSLLRRSPNILLDRRNSPFSISKSTDRQNGQILPLLLLPSSFPKPIPTSSNYYLHHYVLTLNNIPPSTTSAIATTTYKCIKQYTMASTRTLAPLLRRSIVATRTNQSSLRGGASPPLPPFARSPVPTSKVSAQVQYIQVVISMSHFNEDSEI